MAELSRVVRRALRCALAVVITGVVSTAVSVAPALGSTTATAKAPSVSRAHRCSWTTPQAQLTSTPVELADEVLEHMDLAQKISFVGINFAGGYENEMPAMPSLCIPALTLQDGPNGIAYGAPKVTQLPASLGIAASFNSALAQQYGVVEGAEARTVGVDVVQGPDLNLARVPTSGRLFEGYGEDPELVSRMGVADIEGIQSQGVMAEAKHFTAYNQETNRRVLDQVISQRALEELYLVPFHAAVDVAHVASIMCAYGEINGVNTCTDPALYRDLDSWHFTGFVRSDLRTVTNPIAAFRDGLDALKPAEPAELRVAVLRHALPMKDLDDAVRSVLAQMFAYGFITRPPKGRLTNEASTPGHIAFAKSAAEQSMVLLKNEGVLPLHKSALNGLAVIGADATRAAMTAGLGSAHVIPQFISSPLTALRNAARHGGVSFATGNTQDIPITPNPAELVSLSIRAGIQAPNSVVAQIPVSARAGLSTLEEVFRPKASGLYSLALTDSSATWLFLDGRFETDSAGPHGPVTSTVTASLRAGVNYEFLALFNAHTQALPIIGWRDDSPAIAQAVSLARKAHTAVVFASDVSGEASDRPSLDLPGDENALISAVAKVNARTIVVLNTGGAVLMPWLSRVAAVLEAWYPGEQDGPATAAVLLGAVDPSGHLPVTFPASVAQTPAAIRADYPGLGNKVVYGEGLNIGYRYDETYGLRPLFPFGFGLSYTSFSFSNLVLALNSDGVYTVTATVTNTGSVPGTDVMQAYLGFPASAGEPPLQLKAFARVSLEPGQKLAVTMPLPTSGFECYLNNHWTIVAGTYSVFVGDSSTNLPLAAVLAAPPAPRPEPGTQRSAPTSPTS